MSRSRSSHPNCHAAKGSSSDGLRHGWEVRTIWLLLALFLGGLRGTAAADICPYDEVTDLCDIRSGLVTGNCLLAPNSETGTYEWTLTTLTIQAGSKLLLPLSPDSNVRISANGIKVDGELWAGCAHRHSEANIDIELIGSRSDTAPDRLVSFSWHDSDLPVPINVNNVGEPLKKALLVTNSGRLELHGRPKVSWKRLAAPASAGDLVLHVDSAVDWSFGEELVVGSTSADREESEVVKVAAVEGSTITLQSPLAHAHEGRFRGPGVALNAPVGLRSHNIVVRGRMTESGSEEDERGAFLRCQLAYEKLDIANPDPVRDICFGGHTFFVQHSVVHLEHIELRSMGQAMEMARYPVHWHLAGNSSGSYIKSSSIHNSFQRCTTVHGTSDVLVADNVCHETFGHAFYLEDGIETGNTFHHNLVITAREGGSVCTDFAVGLGARSNVQIGPSGFWITNPDNSFTENHVVGCGTGYWFTFPLDDMDDCVLSPGRSISCGAATGKGAGGIFGLSRHYFSSPASGFGEQHWWLNQEQWRTPVRLFRDNVVSGAHRGIFADGRVFASSDGYLSEKLPGGPTPCFGDGCPTCSGPLEFSFAWSPMQFDRLAMPRDRRYMPSKNLIEGFVAAHIQGHVVGDEARGIWFSGGPFIVKNPIFLDVRVGVAAVPDPSGGCAKGSQQAPPGFPVLIQDGVFLAGASSLAAIEIYDAGVKIVNTRWGLLSDATPEFFFAKAKASFGGNGNPLILTGSREFRQKDNEPQFSWALEFVRFPEDSRPKNIANFEPLAWEQSPFTRGSYIYSDDNFGEGAPGTPAIVAADAASSSPLFGLKAQYITGQAECREYLYWTPPQFSCGTPFGRYGRWCGDGVPLCSCGARDDARTWFLDLAPWRNNESEVAAACTNQWPYSFDEETKVQKYHAGEETPAAHGSSILPGLVSGECTFPNVPPSFETFVWDPSCRGSGGLGCNADGIHQECRYCGFGPYADCPQDSILGLDLPLPARSSDRGFGQNSNSNPNSNSNSKTPNSSLLAGENDEEEGKAAEGGRTDSTSVPQSARHIYYKVSFAVSCVMFAGVLVALCWTKQSESGSSQKVYPEGSHKAAQAPEEARNIVTRFPSGPPISRGASSNQMELGEVWGQADDMKTKSTATESPW